MGASRSLLAPYSTQAIYCVFRGLGGGCQLVAMSASTLPFKLALVGTLIVRLIGSVMVNHVTSHISSSVSVIMVSCAPITLNFYANNFGRHSARVSFICFDRSQKQVLHPYSNDFNLSVVSHRTQVYWSTMVGFHPTWDSDCLFSSSFHFPRPVSGYTGT